MHLGSKPQKAAVLALCAAMAAMVGCRGRDDLDGRRRALPGLLDPGEAFTLDVGDKRPVLDLYDNRAAAVVHDAGGLVIECGTADMAKYVEGAYRSPWHLNATDQGQRTCLVDHLAGELYLPIDGDPGGVARSEDGSVLVSLRARAAQPQQLVSVFLNEQRLGDIAMPTTAWKTYRIRAPGSAVRPGENKLRFYFRHVGEIDGTRTAAAFERIRVGTAGEAIAQVIAADTVTHGDERLHALRVSRAARLSYYFEVPADGPALVFAHAAHAEVPAPAEAAEATAKQAAGEAAQGKGAALAVRISAGGQQEPALLWQGTAGERWSEARVDLGAYAGQVVRLDMVSDGPVDWGRPQVVAVRPAERPVLAPARPVDHVIVWVVSALRADRLAGPHAATPAFERLAARGIRFTNAFTTAPVPGAAHVALLTGTYPQQDQVPAGLQTLGERFGQAGFVTALISGNGFINDEAGFARGFASYQNPMRRRHPFQARILWQKARRLLQRHEGERTFQYIVTVEPHLPYLPSQESLDAEWDRGPVGFEPTQTIALSNAVATGTETLTREEQAYIEALYDAEVRDADQAFAQMLDDLEELGIADRTAVVLVGDHGEELFERGGFGHGSHLHQEVLRVPLVIAHPGHTGQGSGTVVDWDASLVDFHATVLGLAGIPPGPDSQGGSLLAAHRDPGLPPPIFTHLPGQGRSLGLGRYKLVVPLHGKHELYDLRTDPGEQQNLLGTMPVVERYLRNVFGIGVAYQPVWRRQRWGHPGNVKPAFAADHGL